MPYTVTGTPLSIDFGATGIDAILQNVRTILTTVQGTVPLDRAFGIDQSPLDSPGLVARAKMSPIIIKAIKTYEPRVSVLAVNYTEDEQGRLAASVTIELAGGVSV
jgi:phage baseplate assembly protein W